MLLPSALPCDGSQATGAKPTRPLLRRFMPYSGSSGYVPTISSISESVTLAPVLDTTVASGFPSPLLSPSSISSGINSTCRALQSFLGVTPSSSTPVKRNRIPLPPSPLSALPVQENRISKKSSYPVRPVMPTRGRNKRSRDDYETSDRESPVDIDQHSSYLYASRHNHGYSFDSGYQGSSPSDAEPDLKDLELDIKQFSTPKRRRRIPGATHLPFGLDRQDFADLEDMEATFSTPQSTRGIASPHSQHASIVPSTPAVSKGQAMDEDEEPEDWWTPLDDAQLVTVVLGKMKLSKRDWEDCAKVLGAEGEGGSLGKRWRWLMEEGKVGFKMDIEEGGRFEGRRASKRQGRSDVRTIF